MIQITVEEAMAVVEKLQSMQRSAQRFSEIMLNRGNRDKAAMKLGEFIGLARAEKILTEIIERTLEEREAQRLEDDLYEEHGYPSEGKPYYALRDGTLVSDTERGDQA